MDRTEAWPWGATPRLRSGAAPKRNFPTPEVSVPTQEELPHLQGAAAVGAQEGLEELLHVQGQKGRPWEDTPCPS